MDHEPDNYREQVYAALTGKVVGVYMGRPFEGWTREAIERRWGDVDRYVHEDLGRELVVADDDITGTVTFVRALEDSGRYADTPDDFFGQTWLNYLLEGQTVLWWGGMATSTEHTAFLRLKHGVPSPRSGAMALNGREVAEQVGAQIFIDAFGLVAPGRPDLAARLAAKAARVSHDGEAVFAAQAVAAMASAAFAEKAMERVLDAGASVVPPDSLIARVHRDVRGWAARDGDWRRTHDRIAEKYGYHRYGGGCHVVPNHAVMVLAWAYAPDDFHEAMKIVNTSGWDTDCNAANVGTVSALVAGLDGIDRRYPFRAPFADRLVLPTADGTESAGDLLRVADRVVRLGRRVMGWPDRPPAKDGAWHHFSLPGARHGYRPAGDFAARGHAEADNVALPGANGGRDGARALAFRFAVGPGRRARLATPLCLPPGGDTASYQNVGVPYLYNGVTVRATGRTGALDVPAALRLFATVHDPATGAMRTVRSDPAALAPHAPFALEWTLDAGDGALPADFGFEAVGDAPGRGELFVDRVEAGGAVDARFALPADITARGWYGWISNLDFAGRHEDRWTGGDPLAVLVKNEGRGVLVTGHRGWRDAAFGCDLHIHAADRAGLVLGYQGMERYYAALFDKATVRWVRRRYGETVLAEAPFAFPENEPRPVRATLRDGRLALSVDGREVLAAVDGERAFDGGGAGLMVEAGRIGFRRAAAAARFFPA